MSLGHPGVPRAQMAAALDEQQRRIANRSGWHDPARQAARLALQLKWAEGVLANPCAHTDQQLTRAARLRGCAIARTADRDSASP